MTADSSAKLDLTLEKKKILNSQIETDLKPVLKSGSNFSLEESWRVLQTIVQRLTPHI